MKITVICDIYGKKSNGSVIAADNLITALKDAGHTVNVVCCDQTKKGLEGFYVVKKLNVPFVNGIVEKNDVTLPMVDKKILRAAIEDADAVHFMMPFSLSIEAVKIAKELHKPTSAGFHVQAENVLSHFGLMNNIFAARRVYKFFYHNLYRYVDVIHYPTQFIRDTFEAVVGPTNGRVISNGVNTFFVKKDVEKPQYLKNKYVLLSTGRLCKEKNQALLIKAVAKSKYKDNIKLILAGIGPDANKLNHLAKKLNVDMETKFFDRNELVDCINYADLYVHPAQIEIESISCLEALSCGLVPVIANSKRSAAKSFANNEYSLFKNNNIKDLDKKIDYWIENPEKKEEVSKEYQSSAHVYEQGICMKQMENMIMENIYDKNNLLQG